MLLSIRSRYSNAIQHKECRGSALARSTKPATVCPAQMKAFLRTLAVLLLTVLVGPCIAHADEWPYAKVTCDKETGQLIVEELETDERERIPREPGVQDLMALTQLRTLDGPAGTQDYRVPRSDFRFECDLGRSHFKVKISPWKFNQKVAGMCGGYDPSIQLSVWRASRKLLDKLIFTGFCNPPESDFGIVAVKLLEGEQAAVILIGGEGGRVERRIPFSKLGKLHREQLHPD